MEDKMINRVTVTLLSTLLISCASGVIQHKYAPTAGINQEEYIANKATSGLVLVAASGKRVWGCGSYQNAELRSIGFDLLPSDKNDELPPDFVINVSAQGFMNYAFLLPPGTYAISYTSIKVASSASEVGYITANRSALAQRGGTFSVGPGENVYIGHFGIDCSLGPTLWRYYAEDNKSFNKMVSDYKSYYPYLSLDRVSYRLFSTEEFGHEFILRE